MGDPKHVISHAVEKNTSMSRFGGFNNCPSACYNVDLKFWEHFLGGVMFKEEIGNPVLRGLSLVRRLQPRWFRGTVMSAHAWDKRKLL